MGSKLHLQSTRGQRHDPDVAVELFCKALKGTICLVRILDNERSILELSDEFWGGNVMRLLIKSRWDNATLTKDSDDSYHCECISQGVGACGYDLIVYIWIYQHTVKLQVWEQSALFTPI